ncbi:MAG: aminotransferase class IV [Alphaproteobacteria bacterium]|nr:aminotransferase class IV [Alphaproteobacteria bacterium]
MSRTWFNGAMVDGPIALDPHDRGLTLGDGLFETMLVVGGTPLWANMHFARMEGSAHELGIPFNRNTLDDAVAAVLDGIDDSHHVLRVTLTRGAAARGLAGADATPALLVTCSPFDPKLMLQPATLLTSTIRRSTASPSTRMKTLSYIDNIAAAREAAARAIDDALMLNTDGRVACTTIANIFLMRGRTLVTPGRDQGILTGVTRQALLAAAHHLGLETEEATVKVTDLFKADAVFLTNSLRLIRPVTSLDQQPLATADLGDLVGALCDTARLQCGRDPRLI